MFNFRHLSDWRKIFNGKNFPIYGILFQAIAARGNAPSQNQKRRRKRQTNEASSTLATPCEPRFIQPDNTVEQFFLIWLCPMDTSEPTPQDQAVLCSVLLQSPLVATCRSPGGDEMTLATVPPPKETRYIEGPRTIVG